LRDCRNKKNNNNNNNWNHKNNKENEDKDNEKKPFPYNCKYCKKKGHMAKDCFKKKRNEKQKGESANAAQDKEDEVGFVMLGLNDPEDIDEWYTSYSVNVTSNECVNESRFTKNEQQERFNNSIAEYLGSCSVVVGAKSNCDNESSDTSDSEDMNNSVIGVDDKEFNEDQAIKKWCNKQIEGIMLRAQLEDELGTQDSDESVVFIGNKVDEKWVCCDDSEEEEDYIKSEVCMVVTDKVEEEELETEGPHEQLGRLNPVFKTFIKMDKWEFEYFYIGMTKYYYYHIPNPEGEEPINPEQVWNFADRYDPYPMMHEEKCRYEEELVVWRKRKLEIICSKGGDELAEWKKLYHEHVAKKKRKYIEGKKRKNVALVTLDKEHKETVVGNVASFANNNKNNSKTMYYSENIYIGDSGASCHMVHTDEGMYDDKSIKEKITIGNGQYIEALKIGKKKGMIKLDDGTIMNAVLNNVKYVPNLAPCNLFCVLNLAIYNLFSITQAISSGWMLGNEGKTILLKNGKSVLKFNKMLKTKSNYVGCAEILPRVDDNIAAPALSPGKGVDIMKFHDMLGHVSENTTRKAAE
jgi:hypothetical protein